MRQKRLGKANCVYGSAGKTWHTTGVKHANGMLPYPLQQHTNFKPSAYIGR